MDPVEVDAEVKPEVPMKPIESSPTTVALIDPSSRPALLNCKQMYLLDQFDFVTIFSLYFKILMILNDFQHVINLFVTIQIGRGTVLDLESTAPKISTQVFAHTLFSDSPFWGLMDL